MELIRKSRLIALILAPVFLFCFQTQSLGESPSDEIHLIRLNDETINPITADYIVRSIHEAETGNAQLLIIELDTPGGLLASTRTIVKSVMASNIPIVVYVAPKGARAGSAGVFITYSAHIACMAPSTNIGAAHPVSMSGQGRGFGDVIRDVIEMILKKNSEEENKKTKNASEKEKVPEEDIMGGKILQDTTAFIKAIAKERGRNIDFAEKSVNESLSITAEEALKAGVIDIIAADEKELLAKLDGFKVKVKGRTVTLNTKSVFIVNKGMNFRQRVLNVLANPNIAYILLLLGFYGLLFEVTHPGVGFPGVAGAICIILAFFSMQTLPTNYAGLALIILSIILFIAEMKVPGFGLLTLGGISCMFIGSLLLFDSPYELMRVSLSLIIAFSLATAIITVGLVRAVFVAHSKKVVSGQEGLIGADGKAVTAIKKDKEGKVFVHGELWNAESDEDIGKDQKIKVVRVHGLNLKVKKVKRRLS